MSKLSYLKIDGEDRYKERNFEEWQEDEELQSLLAGIKTVIFPHAYHKTVEDSVEYARDRAGLVSGGRSSGGLDMTRSGGASSISPQRDPSQASAVDGDTTPNPNKTFDLARIFYATHGHHHPHPADYRLSTYNHVKLSEQRGIEAPFILENEGDLALVARTFSVVDDVKCLRQEHTLGGFFGTQTFNLDEAWQAIASLTPRDEITHVTASSTDYEIMYSNRDNLYYIQSTNGRQTFTLDFLLRTRALATPAITNPEIDTLIKKFKGFELGTLTLASTNPTPQE